MLFIVNISDFNVADLRIFFCTHVLYSHGGDVFTGEGIGGVADQQTGLTHSPEEEEEGQQTISEHRFKKAISKNMIIMAIKRALCESVLVWREAKGRVLVPLTVPYRHWPTFMLPEGHRSPL